MRSWMTRRSCKNCDEEFKTYKSTDKKFCCFECWKKYCDKRKTKECDYCERTFKANRVGQKFCSRECSSKSQRLDRVQKICPECDGEFETVDAYYGNKFCSIECANKSFSRRFEGKEVHTDEHKEYMSKLMSGRNITWNEEIRKNHWSNKENSEEIVEKIRKSMEEKTEDELKRIYDKISQSNIEYIKKNGHKFTWDDCEKGYYNSTKTGNREYYHSSYERIRMRELDENDEVEFWTKKHGIVLKYEHENRIRRYIPDFYIQCKSEKNILEEVKGWVRNEDIYRSKKKIGEEYCEEEDMEYKVNFMEHL